jgi:CHRD domain
MRRLGLWTLLAAVGVLVVVGSAAIARPAKHGDGKTKLDGYQEVVGPGSISTIGKGELKLKIEDAKISYTLTYTLENPATVAHIHFAQRHVGGGVIAFLCGGGTKPPCPSGVGTPATVNGDIVASDIVGPAGQGIEAGSFAEAVRAIRAGATYANVHSTRWPNGEIRGQIGGHGKE